MSDIEKRARADIDLFGLPEQQVAPVLAALNPVIERQRLIELARTKGWKFGVPIFISGPSTELPIEEVSFRAVENVLGSTFVNYHTSRPTPHIGDIDLRTLWGLSAQEIRDKQRAELMRLEAEQRMVEEHEFGVGAFVIDNRLGGIDPTEPNQTARHLILRAVLAEHVRLEPGLEEAVAAGLLSRVVARLFRNELEELFSQTRQAATVVGNLPDEAQQSAGPVILQAVTDKAEGLVVAKAEDIRLAARLAQNPELTTATLKIINEVKLPGRMENLARNIGHYTNLLSSDSIIE